MKNTDCLDRRIADPFIRGIGVLALSATRIADPSIRDVNEIGVLALSATRIADPSIREISVLRRKTDC